MRITDYIKFIFLCFLVEFSNATTASDISEPFICMDNTNRCKNNGVFSSVTNLVDELLSKNGCQKKTKSETPITGTLPYPTNATYSIRSNPSYGSLVFPVSSATTSGPERTYSYTRYPNYFGADSFSFNLSNATSKAIVIVVTEGDANATNYNYASLDISGNEDAAITGDLKIPGLDGTSTISVNDILLPKYGKVKIDNKNGTFAYNPFSMNFRGKDQFIAQVNVGNSDPSIITVNLTVNPVVGYAAFKKALWQPIWGLWHYWNYFRSWGFWS